MLIVVFGFIKSVLEEEVVHKRHFEGSGEIVVEESNKHKSVVVVLELSVLDGTLVFVKELMNSIRVVGVVLEDRQFPLHFTNSIAVHFHIFLDGL